MKKITMYGLTAVLMAGLLTACTAPTMDETTEPSTTSTTPSTSATAPSTTATAPVTIPASTGPSDATEGTGGINSMDPGKALPGMHNRQDRR